MAIFIGVLVSLGIEVFVLLSMRNSEREDLKKIKQIRAERQQAQVDAIRSEIVFEDDLAAKAAAMPPPPPNPLDR